MQDERCRELPEFGVVLCSWWRGGSAVGPVGEVFGQ
jgi:hypothetical protein